MDKQKEIKLERELIQTFFQYKTHILDDFSALNQSNQLLNAIRLFEVISKTLELLANSTEIKKFPKLIHEIRKMDRETYGIISDYKIRYKYEDSEIFRVKQKRDYSKENYIVSTLSGIISDFKEEEINR